MALFSFRHSVKTFSKKREDAKREAKHGQTERHLRYICRKKAAREVLKERLPAPSFATTAGQVEAEAEKRKGRVCERFVIALPIEATPEQRVELARAFCEQLTDGVAGYVAAIHDQNGNDINNPHMHVVAFDHMVRSGGRGRPRSTLGIARKNAVERRAKEWADWHNQLMQKWGFGEESMISHLSFEDCGIERVPTIHEGPGARAIDAKGAAPESKPQWKHVDDGHSRREANQVIKEINALKEKENERNRGLGRPNDPHGALSNERRAESGANNRRNCARDRKPGPTHGQPQENRGIVGADRGGPKTPPFARDAARPNPDFRKSESKPIIGFDLWRRFRRRRGVRRVHRELIWLRDSLRARLLRLRAQRRSEQPIRNQDPVWDNERAGDNSCENVLE